MLKLIYILILQIRNRYYTSIIRCARNANSTAYAVPQKTIIQLFKSFNKLRKPSVLKPILERLEDALIIAGTTVERAVTDLAVSGTPEWVTRRENVAFFGL